MFISFFYFSLFSNEHVLHFEQEKLINVHFNAMKELNKRYINVWTSIEIKLFYTATKIKQKIHLPVKEYSFH